MIKSNTSKNKSLKILFNAGKVICILLYVVSLYNGIKKKKWGLFSAVAITHIAETFIIGIKTGIEHNKSKLKSVICTLIFGFTWWLPFKIGLED